MALAQSGSDEAWADLVRRHHGAVFRATHAALLSREDADDAAQDAWIAAWRALGEFRQQSSFRTWLLAIAWRKALDRRQGLAGWKRLLRIDRAADDDDGPPLDLASRAASAEDEALDRAARVRLKKLVQGLPRTHRDALLLMATRDLPYADAAALLGVPVGTLKYRVSDARRMLRERMGRHQPALRQSASARAAADRSAIGPRKDT